MQGHIKGVRKWNVCGMGEENGRVIHRATYGENIQHILSNKVYLESEDCTQA